MAYTAEGVRIERELKIVTVGDGGGDSIRRLTRESDYLFNTGEFCGIFTGSGKTSLLWTFARDAFPGECECGEKVKSSDVNYHSETYVPTGE